MSASVNSITPVNETEAKEDATSAQTSPSEEEPFSDTASQGSTLATNISAIYALYIVVLGLCLPLSSLISPSIPSHYLHGFYLYLYVVSILFLIYVYTTMKTLQRPFRVLYSRTSSRTDPNRCQLSAVQQSELQVLQLSSTISKTTEGAVNHHGSYYLRCGAIIFGIGSLVYAGLDFGQHFEMKEEPQCQQVSGALKPAARAVFIFLQMYFIFLSTKMIRKRHSALVSFGLLHLVATNICVWMNIIIQETKHEVLLYTQNQHSLDPHTYHLQPILPTNHSIQDEGNLEGVPRHIRSTLVDECRRTNLIGSLLQASSPFLFPCAIEYSLICAAIVLQVLLKVNNQERTLHRTTIRFSSLRSSGHQRNLYSVDCTSSNKGLFLGLFVFVLCILSMTLFFILIKEPDYRSFAVVEIHMAELAIYLVTLIAVLFGIYQVRKLQYQRISELNLDSVLLLIGATGLILYNSFTVVACYFGHHNDSLVVSATASFAMVQAATQVLFISNASGRSAVTKEQQVKKPGREIVTFLIVSNFAMWALITLEKSRVEVHPVQFDFFGLWPWTVISNIFMPLSIFYRYHSTVCLFEIWKKSYKS